MSQSSKFLSGIFKGDRVIWVIFTLLCVFSIVEVASGMATLVYHTDNYSGLIIAHIGKLLFGLACIVLVSNVPYRFFGIAVPFQIASFLMLVWVIVAGHVTNGASRWLTVPLIGLRFQPSEIAKLSSVVLVAYFLSKQKVLGEARTFRWILWATLPVILLIAKDNFSTGLLLSIVLYLIMCIGGISWQRLLKTAGVVLLAGALFAGVLFGMKEPWLSYSDTHFHTRFLTWKARIERFFEAKEVKVDAATYVVTDENRQETYAKVAIADGGLGKFPGRGVQSNFLPQAYSDYIYAIIIEETGLAGGFLVLLLYLILLIRVGIIARRCEKLFPKLLVLGCGLMIGVQALANMAIVVGIFPVTGQPLPLISRGGTSTVITCVYIGIILSVSRFGAGMDGEDEEEDEEDDEDIVQIDSDIDDSLAVETIQSLDAAPNKLSET
ncbi:MAG: FtsW/RodA/SpoVE family cell cycle protein [Tannerella sp.]|jgi:cell division protein FtsW|nr:FtsW/RodA/SpoVE family cell cycle protein [Tannerella sp.]